MKDYKLTKGRISVTTGISYQHPVYVVPFKIMVAEGSKHQCFFCGVSFLKNPFLFTIDHLIPKYIGGTHGRENIVASCSYCNQARGSRNEKESREYLATRNKERYKSHHYFKNNRCLSLRNPWLKSYYKKLTPQRRKEIASLAAKSRWNKQVNKI